MLVLFVILSITLSFGVGCVTGYSDGYDACLEDMENDDSFNNGYSLGFCDGLRMAKSNDHRND